MDSNKRAAFVMGSVFNAARLASPGFILLRLTGALILQHSPDGEGGIEFMRWITRSLATVSFCILTLAISAFGQTDRGTITGTVADATGAVIPGSNVTATNTQTTLKYETVSTETGNFTLTQLPGGTYELTVELPGFKKYVRQGITVLAATTVRIDATLEVGAATEEVTVNADAPLLRTESGELSHNIRTEAVDNLPILSLGNAAGSSGIRNPTAVAA